MSIVIIPLLSQRESRKREGVSMNAKKNSAEFTLKGGGRERET